MIVEDRSQDDRFTRNYPAGLSLEDQQAWIKAHAPKEPTQPSQQEQAEQARWDDWNRWCENIARNVARAEVDDLLAATQLAATQLNIIVQLEVAAAVDLILKDKAKVKEVLDALDAGFPKLVKLAKKLARKEEKEAKEKEAKHTDEDATSDAADEVEELRAELAKLRGQVLELRKGKFLATCRDMLVVAKEDGRIECIEADEVDDP